MPFAIVRNNITDMRVDAIVNTANPYPTVGTGVDTAIHQAAGPKLLKTRCEIGYIGRGMSAITPAFDLPAKYVIHTVGPVWTDGKSGEMEILRGCYESALNLAAQHKCKSVAFPLISSGNYGFPKNLALQTAIGAIGEFLMKHDEMMIYLVVFDRTAYALSEKLFADVKSYIDENLVEELKHQEYRFNLPAGRVYESRREAEPEYMASIEPECIAKEVQVPAETSVAAPAKSLASAAAPTAGAGRRKEKKEARSLQDLLKQLDETFPEALARIIKEKGMKNSEVYTRANLTRQHFSKILKSEGYKPGKEAVLALAIALGLNLDETRDFLARAGYALTRSSKTDIIVQFFIETGNYNIFELEQVLFEFTGKTLINY